MTEKHKEILKIIEEIRLQFSVGDETAINEAFQRLFEKDSEYFGTIYQSIDDMTVLYEMLNVIADNHIRKHSTFSIGVYMMQWMEVFKEFDENSKYSEDEKRPVKESFLKLMVKIREYLRREAKGEEGLKEEQNARNSKNVRPENSVCCLCRKHVADEVGSHAVPHLLLQKVFNLDGKQGRDYETVERHTLADGERYCYLGTGILPEERAEILNHELSQDEIDTAADDHNPLTFDHFFCKDCEKRLSVIESQYAQIINGKKGTYKWSVPYLFWMSVVWRMSITKMGTILPRDHEEKYRKILDYALSLDKDKICDDSRKLGHCAYTIDEVEDPKGEGLGIFGFPTATIPAGFIIGKQIVRFYHSLDKARKVSKKIGVPQENVNDGTKKEVIGKCGFLDFWFTKQAMFDEHLWLNFNTAGTGMNISQFIANTNLEKEHLDATGKFAIFHPLSPDVDGYYLKIPHAIFKISSLIEKGASIEEIIEKTGYTQEEIEVMLSYWSARADAELDSQQ